MNKLWWIGIPALAAFLLVGARWVSTIVQAQERKEQMQTQAGAAKRALDEAHTEKGHREYPKLNAPKGQHASSPRPTTIPSSC